MPEPPSCFQVSPPSSERYRPLPGPPLVYSHGRRHSQRSGGGDGLLVENWFPGGAAVDRFPDAAGRRRRVVGPRIARDACGPADATAGGGADGAELEVLEFRRAAL